MSLYRIKKRLSWKEIIKLLDLAHLTFDEEIVAKMSDQNKFEEIKNE